MAKGIPEGWEAYEKPELAIGEWRFYYIYDAEERSSVLEDNLVLRGDVRMEGQDGLRTFVLEQGLLNDPQAILPSTLAAQAAMFLVHGDSRQSCAFDVVTDPAAVEDRYPQQRERLHPPETVREDGRVVHRAWIDRHGYLVYLVITVGPGDDVQIETSREF
jgi:hypothetical protein